SSAVAPRRTTGGRDVGMGHSCQSPPWPLVERGQAPSAVLRSLPPWSPPRGSPTASCRLSRPLSKSGFPARLGARRRNQRGWITIFWVPSLTHDLSENPATFRHH